MENPGFIILVLVDKNAYPYDDGQYNLLYFLTHCKWQDAAVFSGHNPGYINQQIIHINGHQWIYHKALCYCPHDGDYNCTVDLLGPVYPGH